MFKYSRILKTIGYNINVKTYVHDIIKYNYNQTICKVRANLIKTKVNTLTSRFNILNKPNNNVKPLTNNVKPLTNNVKPLTNTFSINYYDIEYDNLILRCKLNNKHLDYIRLERLLNNVKKNIKHSDNGINNKVNIHDLQYGIYKYCLVLDKYYSADKLKIGTFYQYYKWSVNDNYGLLNIDDNHLTKLIDNITDNKNNINVDNKEKELLDDYLYLLKTINNINSILCSHVNKFNSYITNCNNNIFTKYKYYEYEKYTEYSSILERVIKDIKNNTYLELYNCPKYNKQALGWNISQLCYTFKLSNEDIYKALIIDPIFEQEVKKVLFGNNYEEDDVYLSSNIFLVDVKTQSKYYGCINKKKAIKLFNDDLNLLSTDKFNTYLSESKHIFKNNIILNLDINDESKINYFTRISNLLIKIHINSIVKSS